MTTCLRCDHSLSQHTRPLSDLLGCTAGGCNCVREVAGFTVFCESHGEQSCDDAGAHTTSLCPAPAATREA